MVNLMGIRTSSHVKVNIKIPYLEDEMSVNYYLNDIGARSNVAKFTNSKIEKYIGFFIVQLHMVMDWRKRILLLLNLKQKDKIIII